MNRIKFILLLFVLILAPYSLGRASESPNLQNVLKSRKVIGVIYFKGESVKLSKSQLAEISRIASKIETQHSSDKIVRVEGYTSKKTNSDKALDSSFSRAKIVWQYLKKIETLHKDNLFLTGFNSKQSISKLQGERVEIAIYENPFNESSAILSRN